MLPLDQLTILVVDDDRDTVESLATWLELRGGIAVRAGSARDAWAVLESIAVDAIVTDIVLPGESGLVLSERVRGDARFERTPVIAISGVLGSIDATSALRARLDAFHTKPLHPTVLEQEIETLLRRAS